MIMNFFSVFLLGLRGSITLLNKRNYAAEFSWSPVLDERGTAFSIRPSIGKLATHRPIYLYTKKGPLDIHACPPPACIEMNSICYDVLKVNCKDQ